jgi:hypothetical protein
MSVYAPKEGWKADFTINPNLNIPKVAELVQEAFALFHAPEDDPDRDGLSDILFTLHDHFYPGSSRSETMEEGQARHLMEVDYILMQATANLNNPEIAQKFINEARESIILYGASNDLPIDLTPPGL